MIVSTQLTPHFLSGSPIDASPRPAVTRRGETVLRSSSYLAVRHLSCDYHEGVLTIRGRVPTYYLKQVAQSLLGKLEGVEVINNLVEVRHAEVLPRSRQ